MREAETGNLGAATTGSHPVVAAQVGMPDKETCAVDRLAGDLVVSDYAARVLPGGEGSSSALRGNAEALRLVVDFVAAGKPVAAITHGVEILLDDGILSWRSVTSWSGLTQEVIDAGARWVDQDVKFCRDQGWMLVTGQTTIVLPEFVHAIATASFDPRRSPALSGSTSRKQRNNAMSQQFSVGDHVRWNCGAGYVEGKFVKVHTKDLDYKGHIRRCSRDDPQYEIKSDKAAHMAMHKGNALKSI